MSTDHPAATARPWLPLFIAVCLVAINMRMTITGLGPLLDDIARDQGVSLAALGALASIPLLAWAVVSPLAQAVADRLGLDAAVRSLPGSPINLWLGTGLIGAALAITNVLLPAVIKRDFGARVPLVMSVYSALIGVSGAVGSAIVAPIAHFETGGGPAGDESDLSTLGWRWALLATGATAPLALLIWAWVTRRPRGASALAGVVRSPGAGVTRRVWLDPVAWYLAMYMGAQSWIFYIHATWLSPIDLSRGTDPITAGLHVTLFHMCGIFGSLLMPLIARGERARIMPFLVPITSSIAACGIVFAPAALPAWLILAGLSCGFALGLTLTLIAQRSPSTAAAGAVSGMSQSVGYLIAGVGPILFGFFYDFSGSWVPPLFVLLGGAAVQFGAGLLLSRGRMALADG